MWHEYRQAQLGQLSLKAKHGLRCPHVHSQSTACQNPAVPLLIPLDNHLRNLVSYPRLRRVVFIEPTRQLLRPVPGEGNSVAHTHALTLHQVVEPVYEAVVAVDEASVLTPVTDLRRHKPTPFCS